jgi:hypothetical protein
MLLSLDYCYITDYIVDEIMLLDVDHCYTTTSCGYNHVTCSGSLLYYWQIVDIIMLLAVDHYYIIDKLWI